MSENKKNIINVVVTTIIFIVMNIIFDTISKEYRTVLTYIITALTFALIYYFLISRIMNRLNINNNKYPIKKLEEKDDK